MPTVNAMMDSYSLVHDRVYNGLSVLANDYNSNQDPLAATLINGPGHGSVTLNSDGTFQYTPAAGYVGSDSLTYEAAANGETSQGTVSFNVTNMTPNAMSQWLSVIHDRNLSVNPLLYAYDADGDTLTANIVNGPASGTLTPAAGGLYTFTPAANWVGTVTIDVNVSDGVATSMNATITINVTNQAPSIMSQQFNLAHGQTISNVNPLANSFDADGDTLQFSIYGPPSHGQLVSNGDGTLSYIAPTDWAGTDVFNVIASDGVADSNLATLTFTVTNQPPIASGDEYSIPHDETLIIDDWNGVLWNDTDSENDPLTATLGQTTQHGTLTFNSDGGFTYVPNAGYVGDDTFTYAASDGMDQSGYATVILHVTNDLPVAEADEFYLHAGLVLALDATDGVMHNDYDAGYDALTAEKMSDPLHGTLVFNADGSFTYQADAGYVGDDFFSYRLSDGASTSSTAVVTIHVENASPEGTADTFDVWSAAGISSGSANVLDNDSDADNDALTTVIDMTPFYADAFQFNSDGSFSYTPNITGPQGANFTDFFSYKLFDGTTYSQPITVTLKVTDTAVAKDDGYILDVDGQLTVSAAQGLLANEFNPMNWQMSVELVQAPDPNVATVNLQPDGGFNITTYPSFSGDTILIYAVNRVVDGISIGVISTAQLVVTSRLFVSLNTGLKSVNFRTNATIRRDAPLPGVAVIQNYATPQFLDANANGVVETGDRQYPISFTRNTKIGVQPVFRVNPVSVNYWRSRGTNILVRAISQPVGATLPLRLANTEGLANPPAPRTIRLQLRRVNNEDVLSTVNFVDMDNDLPNFTDYYSSLDLQWQFSPDMGATWITPFLSNSSSNQTFITLENPNGWNGQNAVQRPQIQHTVFYAGAWPTAGATNQAELVQTVFGHFEEKAITRADGTPMKYYGQWNTTATTSPALIAGADGQCGAWTRFFIDVLRAQGGNLTYCALKGIQVAQISGVPLRPTGFLVKDWIFGDENVPANLINNPSGYRYYNRRNNPLYVNNNYSWQVSAVTYSGGLAQNNTRPGADFERHIVVRIGNVLYDPSYGVTYGANLVNPADIDLLRAFEGDALAGYYFLGTLPGNVPVHYIRPVTVANRPSVNLAFFNP
ncbi:MAG: tandem-95 repeat protein [Planctomycetes bacterium]|nr:tandem-95 repeat protein [Planctomycetota bacterium]